MGDVYIAPLLPSHDTYDVRGALQMPTRAQERDQCPRHIKNNHNSWEWKGCCLRRFCSSTALYLGLIRMKWSCSMGAFEILLFWHTCLRCRLWICGGKIKNTNAAASDLRLYRLHPILLREKGEGYFFNNTIMTFALCYFLLVPDRLIKDGLVPYLL